MKHFEDLKRRIPIIKKILISLVFVTLFISLLMGVFSLISFLHRREICENQEPVQIAVFGDSIWDLVRDESGIAERTEEYLFDSANIYNCSIMGSAAAELSTEETRIRPGLTYMVEALVGTKEFQAEVNMPAIHVFRELDPEQIDYLVIAYGLNDYFSAVPISSEDTFDTGTYQGALRSGIQTIQEAYPHIKIILISPTYCQLYSYGKVVADSYDQDYGGGTGEAYALAAKEVAEEMGVTFVDMFHELKINRRNGLRYLVDATHLTEKGREVYATILGDAIISLYKNDSE